MAGDSWLKVPQGPSHILLLAIGASTPAVDAVDPGCSRIVCCSTTASLPASPGRAYPWLLAAAVVDVTRARRNDLSVAPDSPGIQGRLAPSLDNRASHAYVEFITPVAPSRHPPHRDAAARTSWLTASRPSVPSQTARSNLRQLQPTSACSPQEHSLRGRGVRGVRAHPPAPRRQFSGALSMGFQHPSVGTPDPDDSTPT